MDKFIIKGGNRLTGEIKVSGAKNVAMKVILAGLLTDREIFVENVPLISSVYGTADIVRCLGVKVDIGLSHTLKISGGNIKTHIVPLELGGFYRTAAMVMGPLLCRFGKFKVPNPSGCRIGRRPIDRHIEGLKAMGAKIKYKEGYFIGNSNGLQGIRYKFPKNTHTGTETLILAAVLAKGETVLENAACEPEVDDLVRLLNLMGAKIRRKKKRTIIIDGVEKLSGCEFRIMSDRNEVVTFAIAAIASGGDVVIKGTQREYLKSFLEKLDQARGGWEPVSVNKTRFYTKEKLKAIDVTTASHPGFMTDWQAPWALLMTQAEGTSTIHETIYEDRFGYVKELLKMGARIEYFNIKVENPQKVYNFNWLDKKEDRYQAIKIHGKVNFHNGLLEVADLRAGATLILATIIAKGESIIQGVEHVDRGYENLEGRLASLGAKIKRVKE